MRWEDNRRSSNVEDKRDDKQSFGSNTNMGSAAAFLPIIKMLIGTKIGRIVLVIGLIAYFGFGINPLSLLDSSTASNQSSQVVNKQADDKSAQFVSAVLAQTEDIWEKVFQENGMRYQDAKLVLFRNGVKSACGVASSQIGPFYCPADSKVYLDLAFFDELSKKYKAPGEFAQAYVIAHEVGHHVQNILGTLNKVQKEKQGVSTIKQNAIQVKVELQADCYAGIWAHYSKSLFDSLEDGDLEAALRAASAIGDDTLQKQYQGHVVPDSFTHGSSKQRMDAFNKGFINGSLKTCAIN